MCYHLNSLCRCDDSLKFVIAVLNVFAIVAVVLNNLEGWKRQILWRKSALPNICLFTIWFHFCIAWSVFRKTSVTYTGTAYNKESLCLPVHQQKFSGPSGLKFSCILNKNWIRLNCLLRCLRPAVLFRQGCTKTMSCLSSYSHFT